MGVGRETGRGGSGVMGSPIYRPIIFNGPSVCAILDNRKTMTRRVIIPQPSSDVRWGFSGWEDGHGTPIRCVYGQPGDRLWVRETWKVGAWDESDGCIAIDYLADGFYRKYIDVPEPDYFEKLWIQSTYDAEKAYGQMDHYSWEKGESPCRKRSPLFMPRWASRITLEITDIRVERVQNISEEDVLHEGFRMNNVSIVTLGYHGAMKLIWDSINAKRGYSWDSNPWVRVVVFKVIEAMRKRAVA
jgi:hypothetical protein